MEILSQSYQLSINIFLNAYSIHKNRQKLK